MSIPRAKHGNKNSLALVLLFIACLFSASCTMNQQAWDPPFDKQHFSFEDYRAWQVAKPNHSPSDCQEYFSILFPKGTEKTFVHDILVVQGKAEEKQGTDNKDVVYTYVSETAMRPIVIPVTVRYSDNAKVAWVACSTYHPY